MGEAPPPRAPAWERRKLLFFSGHVPKLFNNPVRYRLWRALRASPLATVRSSTIGCNVGAYNVCSAPARIDAEYASFCRSWCGHTPGADGSYRSAFESSPSNSERRKGSPRPS